MNLDWNERWKERYDWHALKQELIHESASLGVDAIGFAGAYPFDALRERLEGWHAAGFASGFEESDVSLRTDPSLHLQKDCARSLISIAVAYPSKMKSVPRSEKGAYRGMMARSSWGRDYHAVLRERLERIRLWLLAKVPELQAVSMVDTGALSDRAVAERAGIGWSAKNCSVISPKLGSWIYLGEMVTNLPFPADEMLGDQCGGCTKCIDACPTGALVGPGVLNAGLCISLITQKKGIIPDEQKIKIGNRLYGCDTCQVVCPKNKWIDHHRHPELEPDPELAKPLLQPLVLISQNDFRRRFGEVSGAWRGAAPIRRNAVIALGHFRDESAVGLLGKVLSADPRVELRESAAWALGRIATEAARELLDRCLISGKETEEPVLDAIRRALEKIRGTAG